MDTPERLKAYAEDHGLDPAHWTLYHGDEKAVRELAAALGVRYRRDASGGFITPQSFHFSMLMEVSSFNT